MMTLVSPDLRERSVSVDMGLTARLYSSLHQICFLRIIMIIVTLCLDSPCDLISELASQGSPCPLSSAHSWVTRSLAWPPISPTQVVSAVWALMWPGP